METLSPDGNVLIPDPPDDDSGDLDPWAGIPGDQIRTMARDVDDPLNKWEMLRAAARNDRMPRSATPEEVLHLIPAHGQLLPLAEAAMREQEILRTAIKKAHDLKSRSEEAAAIKKARLAAVDKAASLLATFEEKLAEMVDTFRPGKKITGERLRLNEALGFKLKNDLPLSVCAWLDGAAKSDPVWFAEFGKPAAEKILTATPSYWKGYEGHLKRVIDRNPVVDRVAAQQHIEEHAQLARSIMLGRLNALVNEDGSGR